MIDARRQSDYIVHLRAPGTQTATTNKDFQLLPFACELIGIIARLGTAGTTGSQICDVNKNGTTIFAKAAKITFATTVATPTAFAADETAVSAPVQFAEGDNISFDVDSIHSGVAAINFSLVLHFRRTGIGGLKKVSAAQVSGYGTY